MSTKSATMASEPSEDFGAKSGVSEADIPEEGVDVELTTDDSTEAVIADGTVASKTSFKSVGFPEEEEEEDLYADSGFLTKVYVSVFDALFNTLLFVLSSAAALLHMRDGAMRGSGHDHPALSLFRARFSCRSNLLIVHDRARIVLARFSCSIMKSCKIVLI